MVMTYEEWAKQDEDPGTIDYLQYLSDCIEARGAEAEEARKMYIAICKADGIDIPEELAAEEV